jgi:ribA/ribD-fused uncharacterized protein
MGSFSGKLFFLSNFYPCVLVYNGLEYKSSEHAFQAAKAVDDFDRERIRLSKTASDAKRLGKVIAVRDDWTAIRLDVMRNILRLKFAIPELKQKLLDIGDEELVELNEWNDTFWGVCNGKGSNYLGRILMDIRKELVAEDGLHQL